MLIRHLLSIEIGSLCVSERSCYACSNSFLIFYLSSSPDSRSEIFSPGLRVSMIGMLESCMFGDLGEGERGDLNV